MVRALAVAAMCAVLACACAGQVIDRVVATVNRDPILQSDVEVQTRFEAMMDQKPLAQGAEAQKASLERLIDQTLLEQQVRTLHAVAATPDEVEQRVAELRRQVPGCETDAGYKATLARYDLGEGEFRAQVAKQLDILRFIDLRLRPSVHVDRRAAEAYYNETFLPEVSKRGGRKPPLTEVLPQIEEVLSQQRVDAVLNDLLKDLREHAEIHIRGEASPLTNAAAPLPPEGAR